MFVCLFRSVTNSSLTNVKINGNPPGDSSPLGESVPNPEQAKEPDPVSLSQGNPPGSLYYFWGEGVSLTPQIWTQHPTCPSGCPTIAQNGELSVSSGNKSQLALGAGCDSPGPILAPSPQVTPFAPSPWGSPPRRGAQCGLGQGYRAPPAAQRKASVTCVGWKHLLRYIMPFRIPSK